MDIEELGKEWQRHKELEREHKKARRRIENLIVAYYKLPPDLDETTTKKEGQYVVKIVGRLDRKVDSDKVQDLATEHGLEGHLPTLFRWKPELNVKAWHNSSEEIRQALAPAITTKPGRPSFTIVRNEE